VVLKVIARRQPVPAPETRNYWKREFFVAQSHLLESLPGPIRAPKFYRTDERPNGFWLWMEHVHDDRPGAWTVEDYSFAARQLGRWNGACAALPPPTEPWLQKHFHRAWETAVNTETVWQAPLHQKYISDDTRNRFARLWAERELYYAVLEALPQCLNHFDCNRRNLIIRRDSNDQAELVVLDWSFCGVGALGIELGQLVGGSVSLLEWPSVAVADLHEAAFWSYSQGLREAGWSGDLPAVRLANVASLGIYRAASMPLVMNAFCSPESRSTALQAVGIAEEDLYQHLLPLLYYWLDCADEARALMRVTGMVAA
jgi:hypothetical protein